MTVNISKAWVLALGVFGVVVLMAIGRVSESSGLPVLTAFVGYAVGNGIAARSGTTATPVIAPAPMAPETGDRS